MVNSSNSSSKDGQMDSGVEIELPFMYGIYPRMATEGTPLPNQNSKA